MKLSTLTLALLIGGSSLAVAQEATTPPSTPQDKGTEKTPVVTKRQMNQHARIRQGVKSGELTPAEAARLRREERRIQKDKQAAKADGKVTPEERKKLQGEENKVSKDIYKKKHNAAVRKGSEAAQK